jgi:hypothetical protein
MNVGNLLNTSASKYFEKTAIILGYAISIVEAAFSRGHTMTANNYATFFRG